MQTSDDDISEGLGLWKELASKGPKRAARLTGEDGAPLKTLYTPLGRRGKYVEKIGFPGLPPFTRGVYPTMYRGRPWTMRQYSGYASAEATNKRYKMLLKNGQTGLSMAFDLPTQLGLDPDDERAYYEVGRVGVPVPTWKEMDIAFAGIRQDGVSTSMTINATAMEELAMYVVSAESKGISPASLEGTVQNDILKEFVARNNYIYPPGPSMRYAADVVAYCASHMPKWNGISISGYHFEEAGATPSQEVAFTLADGVEYVKSVTERGIPVDGFAPRLSFFFSARTNLVEQVAKFRAARRIWCRVMEEVFGARDQRSKMLRFHVQTAGVQMTSSQVEVNIVRTTVQALAAVLGGAQSLHVNSYDEALGLPTEEAARLSLRVQQALLYETDAAASADPLGGSYMLEELTDELEERATSIMKAVEKLGGMVKAVESGYPQKEIERASYEYQLRVEKGEVPIIGVSVLREEGEKPKEALKIDPEARRKVIRRLKECRRARDASKVGRALSKLSRAAEGEENLFPYVLSCVREGASVGEVSSELRRVWGEWDRS